MTSFSSTANTRIGVKRYLHFSHFICKIKTAFQGGCTDSQLHQQPLGHPHCHPTAPPTLAVPIFGHLCWSQSEISGLFWCIFLFIISDLEYFFIGLFIVCISFESWSYPLTTYLLGNDLVADLLVVLDTKFLSEKFDRDLCPFAHFPFEPRCIHFNCAKAFPFHRIKMSWLIFCAVTLLSVP